MFLIIHTSYSGLNTSSSTSNKSGSSAWSSSSSSSNSSSGASGSGMLSGWSFFSNSNSNTNSNSQSSAHHMKHMNVWMPQTMWLEISRSFRSDRIWPLMASDMNQELVSSILFLFVHVWTWWNRFWQVYIISALQQAVWPHFTASGTFIYFLLSLQIQFIPLCASLNLMGQELTSLNLIDQELASLNLMGQEFLHL